MRSEWEEIVAQVNDGKPYHCPLCYEGFDTHDLKSEHLADAHGYQVLEIVCAA